ncbi:hypothetical protein ANCCAN_02031 [Ancylostoma caninum]|uniref:Uncharacterized protein n=1 Tax=Ancylostoma caninum TaxID=29170 RepID=A0A368H5R4_ANCCA|nr:hypothetical protein ANCCAN_02031 [Ancylostoma caninum]
MHSAAPNIRSFWEANIALEEEEKRHALRSAPAKPYSFPKWRSTDALSASLVASNSVDVPQDSVIPERRLQKMRETDRKAVLQKALIHEQAEPPRRIHKGKSLDSLVMQLDYQPWYDRDKIRNSVSRESIANIAEARERFEPSTLGRVRRHSGHSTQTAPAEFSSVNGMNEVALSHDRHLYEATTNTYHVVDNGYQPEFHSNGAASSHKYPTRHERGFSLEEQLFMLYMKQNPEIVSSLGLEYSPSTGKAMEELPWRMVELRLVDGGSGSPALSQSPRPGRFLKKCQTAPSNHIRKGDVPAKENDENPRFAHGAMPAEKRIGSLIKYEMMRLKEREDELRKSRRDLGLPSLEETMELWKQGNSDGLSYRSAGSYARMNDNYVVLLLKGVHSFPFSYFIHKILFESLPGVNTYVLMSLRIFPAIPGML